MDPPHEIYEWSAAAQIDDNSRCCAVRSVQIAGDGMDEGPIAYASDLA